MLRLSDDYMSSPATYAPWVLPDEPAYVPDPMVHHLRDEALAILETGGFND